jgi:hypothetical protein
VAVGLALAAPAARAAFDEALYARLLQSHTREVADLAGTRVDYAGLGRASEWRTLVGGLDPVDPATVAERRARLAFWINAYNVLAMDLVVRSYPVASIRDIGSLFFPVWGREAGRAAGAPRTLEEIEHQILRPIGDPRIHAAIVCASTSCPSLRREPFTAGRVEAQLDDAMRRFLADPRKGLRVDAAHHALVLSRIFEWFEEDFAKAGGVRAFVRPYLSDAARADLDRAGADAAISYFDYDWALNDLARAREP